MSLCTVNSQKKGGDCQYGFWSLSHSEKQQQQHLHSRRKRVGRMGMCPPGFCKSRQEDRNRNRQYITVCPLEFSSFRHLWALSNDSRATLTFNKYLNGLRVLCRNAFIAEHFQIDSARVAVALLTAALPPMCAPLFPFLKKSGFYVAIKRFLTIMLQS